MKVEEIKANQQIWMHMKEIYASSYFVHLLPQINQLYFLYFIHHCHSKAFIFLLVYCKQEQATRRQFFLTYRCMYIQEIEFIKKGSLTSGELDALVSVLQLASGRFGQNRTLERKPKEGITQKPRAEKAVAALESMGVRIYGLDEPQLNSSKSEISWENIAGYDQQKRYIELYYPVYLFLPHLLSNVSQYICFLGMPTWWTILINQCLRTCVHGLVKMSRFFICFFSKLLWI